jgi:hypothetical protein
MPLGRISKRSVDKLKCPSSKDRVFLWDNALAGFGVAAFPSKKKTYVAQFRKDGRSRRVAIGDHGRLTAEEARSQAKTILGQVEQGVDPAAERRKARAVPTFSEVAGEFMRLHVKAKRKGRSFWPAGSVAPRAGCPIGARKVALLVSLSTSARV